MAGNNVTSRPHGSRWITATVDISVDDDLTARVDIAPDEVPVCFYLPATFDGTTLTFKVSESENGTYIDAYKNDGSTALGELTGGASKAVWIEPAQAVALGPHWKIATATQSTTDTIISILVRKLH